LPSVDPAHIGNFFRLLPFVGLSFTSNSTQNKERVIEDKNVGVKKFEKTLGITQGAVFLCELCESEERPIRLMEKLKTAATVANFAGAFAGVSGACKTRGLIPETAVHLYMYIGIWPY
jgi:hypothetical protein